MHVVLISTYELGHQPFGLASPAARLEHAGASVTCLDLAVQELDAAAIAAADLVAFYLPMHTATRLATGVIAQVRQINPAAHLCCYGLYAPVNEPFLRSLGAGTILGGEFEDGLVSLITRLAGGQPPVGGVAQPEPIVSRGRQHFLVPDRSGLPALHHYAHVIDGDGSNRVAGYTEATRGCKHRCRHCPIVPVYDGIFRAVPRDIVLEDIRQQVAAGARHITFGDPDFFNGPGHALPLVEALHRQHPDVTYDVTIKIEHLLKHAALLPVLRATSCLFVTSAVESVDDRILAIFDKGHTRADVVQAVALLREAGLPLNPTFVTFTPWTTLAGYGELLRTLFELDLVDNVAPVQYAIRLLIPAGSRLLELPDVQDLAGPFDAQALAYPWANPDAWVDALYDEVRRSVQAAPANADRRQLFQQIWRLANAAADQPAPTLSWPADGLPEAPVPHMSEPWFC